MALKADGVILYAANVVASTPTQYMAIYMMNGYVHLLMKSTSAVDHGIQLLDRYNDGEYHDVS